MNIADKVKMEFEDAIRSAIKDWQRDADEPANLFSRNRKLDQVTMIKLLCLMGGNSLRKELYDYPSLKVSASSFSERRAAIPSELLYYVLRRFSDTDNGNDAFLYKGRKLIGIDGVNFNTALNKDTPSFMPASNWNSQENRTPTLHAQATRPLRLVQCMRLTSGGRLPSFAVLRRSRL